MMLSIRWVSISAAPRRLPPTLCRTGSGNPLLPAGSALGSLADQRGRRGRHWVSPPSPGLSAAPKAAPSMALPWVIHFLLQPESCPGSCQTHPGAFPVRPCTRPARWQGPLLHAGTPRPALIAAVHPSGTAQPGGLCPPRALCPLLTWRRALVRVLSVCHMVTLHCGPSCTRVTPLTLRSPRAGFPPFHAHRGPDPDPVTVTASAGPGRPENLGS